MDITTRIAELNEEYQFYLDNINDFSYGESTAEFERIEAELAYLETQEVIENTIDNINNLGYQEEEEVIEVAAETVEDDWLLEEWNNICDDPRGTRFQRPRPVFVNFIQYLLFITGQVVRSMVWRLEPQVQ